MRYSDDSLMLHTDLYQINMVETYWKDNVHERKAVFEMYFRKLPFGNGYAVFAGLERVMDIIENFHFSKTDIEYLREVGYSEEFLSYLSEIRFTGDIHCVKEGEIVFANEPLLRVEATLA